LHAYAKTGKIYSAHTDAVGNVRAITDSLGGTGATYGYTVWGADAGTTNQAGFGDDMRARFKGALRFDDDVELYYMRNRWYEPHSGRFLSEDPIGLGGGINPYVFGANDPINLRDPAGVAPDSVGGNWRDLCPLGGIKDFDTGECRTDDGHVYDPDVARDLIYQWSLGYKVYINGAAVGNPAALMMVLMAANSAGTSVFLTGERSFYRTAEQQAALRAALGPELVPLNSLHLNGNAIDFALMNSGVKVMTFARILDGIVGRNANEIGVYYTDGHIHFGINRRSGTSSRYAVDARGRYYW